MQDLFDTIKNNDLEKLKYLVENGANIETKIISKLILITVMIKLHSMDNMNDIINQEF